MTDKKITFDISKQLPFVKYPARSAAFKKIRSDQQIPEPKMNENTVLKFQFNAEYKRNKFNSQWYILVDKNKGNLIGIHCCGLLDKELNRICYLDMNDKLHFGKYNFLEVQDESKHLTVKQIIQMNCDYICFLIDLGYNFSPEAKSVARQTQFLSK